MRIGIDCRKVADFGIGTYIQGLTHALVRRQGSEEYVFFAQEHRRDLLPESPRVRVIPSDAPLYSGRELFSLGAAARRMKLDLFHAPHYVVPFTTVPVVVTIHDLIHLHLPATRVAERSYARWMVGRAVRKARRIFTVSDAIQAEIASRFPRSRNKLVVTPNGVNPMFSPEPEPIDSVLLDRLELRPRGYFLFVGNRKPHKNVERLLAAWRLMDDESGLRLVLAGGEWAPHQNGSMTQDGKSSMHGVTTTGRLRVEDLGALYRNALALVQPSLEEGFGLPVVEAMASGTPVICSKIPALVEVAGSAAISVDPRDAGSIAAAMQRLSADAALRRSLREAGLARARVFTWERCAERTLEVYREITAGRIGRS